MREKLVFQFLQNGRPLPIDEIVSVNFDLGGIVLNGEKSAWPRGLRFDFEGVGKFKDLLNLLRNQTSNGDHRFSVTVENGNLCFTTLSPDHIPMGTYDYRIRIADLDIKNGDGRIQLREGDPPVTIQLNVRPERRGVMPTESIQTDGPIANLVNGSSLIDDKSIINWLRDDAPRPKRKACLLNILAKLRVSPTEERPLIDFLREIFLVDVSRIYARVNPELLDVLLALDRNPEQPFSLDHGPLDPIHQKLLRRIPKEDQDVSEEYREHMKSFRQDTQPSLQIVVFPPPDDSRGCYADIDIDLGNPKRDLAGFFIHLGELITEGSTDHLKLNRTLRRDEVVKAHLHYTITENGEP